MAMITDVERELEEMEADARNERREVVCRSLCRAMGWEYSTGPVWGGLRKIALAEAVALGMEKAEEILRRLDEAYYLIDQLDGLAVKDYPSLYARAQKWKEGKKS